MMNLGKSSFASALAGGVMGVFATVWVLTPAGQPAGRAQAAAVTEQSVYYSGCNEARAAGAAPIYRGQPGYRPEMDGDSDGIACEPRRY